MWTTYHCRRVLVNLRTSVFPTKQYIVHDTPSRVDGVAVSSGAVIRGSRVMGQFANFWYNASHWHHIFQIGLFNFKRHLDQLLLCILTCTSRWLSLKHPLETNSCWQHVTLTSCQPCIPQKKIQGHPKHFILSSTHVLMHIWGLILKLHLFEVNVTLTTWCQCDFSTSVLISIKCPE